MRATTMASCPNCYGFPAEGIRDIRVCGSALHLRENSQMRVNCARDLQNARFAIEFPGWPVADHFYHRLKLLVFVMIVPAHLGAILLFAHGPLHCLPEFKF